jgi:hypothetical protein
LQELADRKDVARGSDFVGFRKVISEDLIKAAFLLGFTFQVVQVLD